MGLDWYNTTKISEKTWKCGYCGNVVGGEIGYRRENQHTDRIYICPRCKKPTAFIKITGGEIGQYPGPVTGNSVSCLPKDIEALYSEIRRCIQYTAYTSAVLSMRKLLMHVAVEQGADENIQFVQYIEYLDETGWIPPSGREWVDSIRKKGNEATHQIVLVDEEEAKQLLRFVEMLLKIIYEFPM